MVVKTKMMECYNSESSDKPPSLMDKLDAQISTGTPFFSLEFFPPRTEVGATKLISRYNTLHYLLITM